jgi:hypothetical protein
MARRLGWASHDHGRGERRKQLSADKLVRRQAWRDRRLMALAAHKRRADKEIGR